MTPVKRHASLGGETAWCKKKKEKPDNVSGLKARSLVVRDPAARYVQR